MNTTLKFYVSIERKRKTDNQLPIYIRVIHNRKKAEGKLSTIPISEKDLQFWNTDLQRFNSKKSTLTEYNILLNEIQNEFHNYSRMNLTKMGLITAKELRDHLLSREFSEVKTTSQVAEEFYTEIIEPDLEKSSGTKRNYRKSVNHFQQFLKYKKLQNLPITDFKRKHASMFVDYLKSSIAKIDKKGLNNQSTNSIIKNVRPIFKKLYIEEVITINPFEGITVSFKKAVKPRLTNEHYKNIIDLDLSHNQTLNTYKDLFLFLCYTGLSYCDVIDLRSDKVNGGKLEVSRKKSKVPTVQFLIGNAVAIMKNYEDVIPEKRLLPKKSLDKMNLNLKLIGVMAGVPFPLTTYAARRFFRQSIYESGINEPLVRKCLMGHSSSNDIDSHYLLVTDEMLKEAKDKLDIHFNKF